MNHLRIRLAALIGLVLPGLCSAAWNAANDEANRQRMMNSMRASAAASDRRSNESLERSRASYERNYGGNKSSPMSGSPPASSSRAYSAPSSTGGGNSAATTEEFTIYVQETEAQTIARVTREAQAGSMQSQFNLARILYTGYGVARDDTGARRWFAAAAAQGHHASESQYGAMLYNGQGGPEDQRAGLELMRKAAAAGDPYGKALTGFYTIKAQQGKPDADLRPAVAMLESAADNGQLLAQATLGRLVYMMGMGAKQDYARAAHYLALAKDDPGALTDLSRLTMMGMGGLQRDEAAAAKMLKTAADLGQHEAQALFAMLLVEGKHVPRDEGAAARYAHMSAQAGDVVGQLVYAKLLYFGQGLSKNVPESALWFRKSAAQGNTEAIAVLKEPEFQ